MIIIHLSPLPTHRVNIGRGVQLTICMHDLSQVFRLKLNRSVESGSR